MDKKSILMTSLFSIGVLGSIVAGATYALFTSEDNNNFSIVAGDINVSSSIEDIKLYSFDVLQTDSFTNGGTVEFSDDGTFLINGMSEGDRVNFNVNLKNDSSIKLKYRIISEIEDVSGVAKRYVTFTSPVATWSSLEISEKNVSLPCSIELPLDTKVNLDGSEIKIKITIQAVQHNAKFNKCTFYNEDGSEVLWVDEYIDGSTPYFGGVYPQYDTTDKYYFSFLTWNKDLDKVEDGASVYALMQKEIRTFDIAYYDYDGTHLYTDYDVQYGEYSQYTDTPRREPDLDNNIGYVFSGWTNDGPVTSDVIRVAQYDTEEIFIFELDEASNTYALTGLNRRHISYSAEIPSTYKGLPVTTIKNYAILPNDNYWLEGESEDYTNYPIFSFRIPSSITTIEQYAFNDPDDNNGGKNFNLYFEVEEAPSTYYCLSETNRFYAIYYGVESDEYLLYNDEYEFILEENGVILTSYLANYYFDSSNNDVYIPSTIEMLVDNILTEVPVKEIGAYSFARFDDSDYYGFANFNNIYIPEGVEKIQDYAFLGAKKTLVIDLPTSITSIGDYAFSGCTSLSYLYISANVESIGEDIAYGNSRLAVIIEESEDNPNWNTTWDDSIVWGTYYNCTEDRAFIYNDIYYIINDNDDAIALRYIGSSYKDLNIPAIVNNHDVVEIGKGFAKNFEYEWWDREYILLYFKKITIPSSLITINDYAFYASDFDEIIINNDSKLEKIGNYAFASTTEIATTFTKFYLPNSVKEIGDYAFYYRERYDDNAFYVLDLVVDDDFVTNSKLTHLGNYAFYGRNIKDFEFPNSIEFIGSGNFADTSYITSYYIPASVTHIGTNVFNLTNVTSLQVDDENTVYDSRNNSNSINETATNTIIYGTGTTIFDDTLTAIGDYAFYGCSSLKSIEVGGSIVSVGNYAFANCGNLRSIAFKDSVSTLGDNVFDNCNALQNIVIDCLVTSIPEYFAEEMTSLKTVTISGAITDINYYSFKETSNLSYIILGENVKTIEYCAFYYSGLKTIYYEGDSEKFEKITVSTTLNDPFIKATVYYYATCVHEEGQWCYIGEEISTELKISEWTKTADPTCEEYGNLQAYCSICQSLVNQKIAKLPHTYVDGYCSECDAEEPKFTITNNSTYAFSVTTASNSDGVDEYTFVSTNHNNSSSSSIILEATGDIVVKFNYSVSSESNCDKLYIYQINASGTTTSTKYYSGSQSGTLTYTLTAGEKIKFTYSKDGSVNSGTDTATISGLTVTPVTDA